MPPMTKNPALLKHALLLLLIALAACTEAMADDEADAKARIAQLEKKYSLTDEQIRRTCVALSDGYGSTLERAVMLRFCLGGTSVDKSMFDGTQEITADRMEMLQSDCRNKLKKGSFAYNEGVIGLQYELHIPGFDKKTTPELGQYMQDRATIACLNAKTALADIWRIRQMEKAGASEKETIKKLRQAGDQQKETISDLRAQLKVRQTMTSATATNPSVRSPKTVVNCVGNEQAYARSDSNCDNPTVSAQKSTSGIQRSEHAGYVH
jgi:hypothetical protein